ncbi:MAG TPA: DUF1772 domain-containing protein [Pyrinomonadaceae bacterium]
MRQDKTAHEEARTKPKASEKEPPKHSTGNRKAKRVSATFVVLSVIFLGILFFVALGFAFYYFGKNPTAALWWGVASAMLAVFGIAFYIQGFVIPIPNTRAVMNFIKTIPPSEASKNGQVETIFRFQNTGGITAREVKVSDLEVLLIDPDGNCIHRRGEYGGPKDIGSLKDYDVGIVVDYVFQFHTTR